MVNSSSPARAVPLHFSQAALRARPSGIRAAQAERADMIAFSKGHPDPSLFPVQGLTSELDRIMSDNDAANEALQYSAGAGTDALRGALCGLMARRGVSCAPDNILVTNGSQQGLYLAALAFADQGSTVVARQPVYTGALQVFDAIGMTLTELDTPADDPRLIYEIPNFHNPTGGSLDLASREKLVAMAHRTGAILIEDDPYGLLRFDDAEIPGLLSLDARDRSIEGARTLYLGSLSKTVAPGLRIGWVAGPADIIQKLALLKYVQDIQSGTLVQNVAAGILQGTFEDDVAAARAFYRDRRDALVAALETHFRPRGRWVVPGGGFFLWIELAGGMDASQLLSRAIERGVNFVPGSAFGPSERFGAYLRLSFSCTPPDDIEEGVKRLAAAYDELLSAGQTTA